MTYAHRDIVDGKHVVRRPGRGFDIKVADALTAESVASALNRAYEHGRQEVQTAIKDILNIEGCYHGPDH